MIAPSIPVQAINQMLPELITPTDSNLVVMIMAQEKDGKVYPTEKDMAAAVAAARAEDRGLCGQREERAAGGCHQDKGW